MRLDKLFKETSSMGQGIAMTCEVIYNYTFNLSTCKKIWQVSAQPSPKHFTRQQTLNETREN